MTLNEKLNEFTQMGGEGESFKCLEKEWTRNVKYNGARKINESYAEKGRESKREERER